MTITDLLFGLPFILYAETHYRFRFFPSFLKKAEPELIADVPHRVEPGRPLPILVIAKDADRYPFRLLEVHVTILQNGSIVRQQLLLKEPQTINDHFWWKTWKIDHRGLSGWVECDVLMRMENQGKSLTYRNDNHRTSSHRPLKVFLSRDKLPQLPGLYLGDPHTHSNYTEDQVEFGAPLEASRALSKAMGLSFFCATDHSYDLDDRIDDYLINDKSAPKWRLLRKEASALNSKSKDFAIIIGEEISCRNNQGENVHLLLMGDDKFFHGSGDGAEHWFETDSENSVIDVMTNRSPDSVAVAAHAMEPIPILQQKLLGRGSWTSEDLKEEGLEGIQFANGNRDAGFQAGYQEWIRLLLEGRKLFAVAGNDAHGNFSRFRQIGIPFMKIREQDSQLFGKMRTGIFADKLSPTSLLRALKTGACILSDGPVANIRKRAEKSKSSIGQTYAGSRFRFAISARSSSEFGELNIVRILLGEIGADQEREIFSKRPQSFNFDSLFTVEINRASYVRAEIHTSVEETFDSKSHFCYTNPVWLNPTKK